MLGVALVLVGFCGPILTPGYGWAWLLVTVGIAFADVRYNYRQVKM